MFGSSMGKKRKVNVCACVQVGEVISNGLLITVPSNIDVIDFKEKVQEEYKVRFGKDIVAPEVS
jgi:hypothetical protein